MKKKCFVSPTSMSNWQRSWKPLRCGEARVLFTHQRNGGQRSPSSHLRCPSKTETRTCTSDSAQRACNGQRWLSQREGRKRIFISCWRCTNMLTTQTSASNALYNSTQCAEPRLSRPQPVRALHCTVALWISRTDVTSYRSTTPLLPNVYFPYFVLV